MGRGSGNGFIGQSRIRRQAVTVVSTRIHEKKKIKDDERDWHTSFRERDSPDGRAR